MSTQDRLLSEEELRNELFEQIKANNANVFSGTNDVDGFVGYLVHLINTQLRLFAESIIGDDEEMPKREQVSKSTHGKLFYTYSKGSSPTKVKGRNELRAEQRASIYKQNADDFRRIK